MKKEDTDLKKKVRGYMGEFGGRKGKGEIMSLYYNLKMKGNLKKQAESDKDISILISGLHM